MWVCPACENENPDTGVGIQACQACGDTVEIVERTNHTSTANRSTGTGWAVLLGIAIGVLLVLKFGPAINYGIQDSYEEDGGYASFDEHVTSCISEGGPPTYDVVRNFEFQHDDRFWNWQLQMSTDIHDCLADPTIRDGHGRFDYAQYVTARFDDKIMAQIVSQFREVQDQEGYSDRELAEMVLSFVQGLVYAPDDVTAGYDEWPRFPLETLYMRGGDCEDTSILYASLIRAMGYGAVLLAPPGHMSVGVAVERTQEGGVAHGDNFYAYAETTGEGFKIGDLPDVYHGTKMQVFTL